jgi:hypothetical protein
MKGDVLSLTVEQALERGGVVDITTTGRKSGRSHRVEIVFHNIDGDLYISGRPGARDWYANVLADPRLTLHLKKGVAADITGVAEPVIDVERRAELLRRILVQGFRVDPDDAEQRLPVFVESAPLIRLDVDGDPG